MSVEIRDLLAEKFNLGQAESELLLRNIRHLGRPGRRLYFQKIKSRQEEFAQYLKHLHLEMDQQGRQLWLNATVRSLMDKKGEPDLVDAMVMNVLGRLEVYKKLRETSEVEGVKLSAMTSFGGLSMVLYIVVIVTALILYFWGQ